MSVRKQQGWRVKPQGTGLRAAIAQVLARQGEEPVGAWLMSRRVHGYVAQVRGARVSRIVGVLAEGLREDGWDVSVFSLLVDAESGWHYVCVTQREPG